MAVDDADEERGTKKQLVWSGTPEGHDPAHFGVVVMKQETSR